ncbi:MAG: TetR/AcrR family transcriptional regulator [Thiobacillus sp.]|jgi:AcrR family transcriptional regulator|uniref:TetR/AcrR family transcriptional regulator n=1 Tax=Thiobacillus sp. TaxID=924 RepID=UPI002895B24B|nr:TetR/AcrR family transcriptional regulator [Thiobacillus sp.]MDT3707619.1 TetR/AcrR family transcriptional regulator [Thiobacillus sp.]
MPTATYLPPDTPRAETRRTQIRAAAEQCFRQHGFHGTSIAQISKAAGMSTGHIYHYFENKEAIIADIVAQDVERLLTLTAELRSASDMRSAMVARAVEGVEDNLDPGAATLQLEIVAEAARNPRVAEIVRTADRQCRESLRETIRTLRQAAGHRDSKATLSGMVEALAAMFEGLQIRTIRNPDLDQDAVVQTFRRMIHDLLTQPS